MLLPAAVHHTHIHQLPAVLQAQHPEHIPRAMVGVVCVAAIIYVLLSLGLALMVPLASFGVEHGREFQHAAYSTSFLKWAGKCHGRGQHCHCAIGWVS